MLLGEMERNKAPFGEVTLVGLGRLGLRTALNLMQVHRGGPKKINLIDGQKISSDDLVFRMIGAISGDYKVSFLKSFAGENYSREITAIPQNICKSNLDLITGDVVCIEIAGGDTIPVTAEIIKYARKKGAFTISTMGVFGIYDEEVKVADINTADQKNPVVCGLKKENITENHLLIGTGKLIRDWEPVTPYVLDRVAVVMASEILKKLNSLK